MSERTLMFQAKNKEENQIVMIAQNFSAVF